MSATVSVKMNWQWAPKLRLHLILDATHFIQHLTNHVVLEQLLGGLIRSGYVGYNPFATKGYYLKNRTSLERMAALRSILALYEHIINHSHHDGQRFTLRQLVYVKLECPQDGSLGGLCKAFFKEVDRLLETNMYRLYVKNGKRTIDEMLIDMAGFASRHFLGVLLIDEIQNWFLDTFGVRSLETISKLQAGRDCFGTAL